jgi:hypothetical protein
MDIGKSSCSECNKYILNGLELLFLLYLYSSADEKPDSQGHKVISLVMLEVRPPGIRPATGRAASCDQITLSFMRRFVPETRV